MKRSTDNRRSPAEYIARKYNIRGDADGEHRREDSGE